MAARKAPQARRRRKADGRGKVWYTLRCLEEAGLARRTAPVSEPTQPLPIESGAPESSAAQQPPLPTTQPLARPLRTEPLTANPTPTEEGGAGADAQELEVRRWQGRIVGGRYSVGEVLGRGGMGLVFRAKHVGIGRSVALKILRPDLLDSDDAVTRFAREARAAASIGHPNVVEVFDFGHTEQGEPWLAMELLEGETLGQRLRRSGPLPVASALRIVRQVCRALAAAHARGVIHRDLKSDNVFLVEREGEDFVKLVDFGISKLLDHEDGRGPATRDGVVLGTPHYMAPELVEGKPPPDHRVDLYALGCIAYEALTGQLPFNGRTPLEVAYKHVHASPAPPSRARPELTAALDAALLRSLAKDPAARYQTAEELEAALLQAERAKPSRRGYALAGLAGVSALVATLLAVRPFRHGPAPHPEVRTPPRSADAGVVPVVRVGTAQDAAVAASGARQVAPNVTVELRSTPRATVLLDGRNVGTTPLALTFGPGERHRALFEAPGFLPHGVDLGPATGPLVQVTLHHVGAVVHPEASPDASRAHPEAGTGASSRVGAEGPREDPVEGLKLSPYQQRGEH